MEYGIEAPIFLSQGSNPNDVAEAFAAFVDEARQSLHIAIYDFQLEGQVKTKVVEAISRAADRGIDVKIAYDHTKQNEGRASKGDIGSDPAPRGTMAFVIDNFPKGPHLKTKAIAGSHLMHNKYVIRDGDAVWTGSANFTMGAWSLQENNILRLHSRDLAASYEQDFRDLWQTENISQTGVNDYVSLTIGKIPVEAAFCPGEGSAAASLFVDAISGATDTLWVSTMVLSSGAILGALGDFIQSGGTIRGIYDATQMARIEEQWKDSPQVDLWNSVKADLVGKRSTPYSANAPHDFMHNKVLVTEKVVVTGSFNMSKNAERNAENCLSITSPKLAAVYKTYVEHLIERYTV